MDNGMIPNVLLSCGGWGCRHNWRPISVLVLNELYKGRQVLTARELVLLIGKTREITVLEPLKVA
jgi:hypothetical protein